MISKRLFTPAPREEFEHMADTDLAKREIASFYRCDLNAGGFRSGNRNAGRAVQVSTRSSAALVSADGRSYQTAQVVALRRAGELYSASAIFATRPTGMRYCG
jgi:hypothetical protein